MLAQAALAGLNHLLRDAAWARARLAPFAGRCVRVLLPIGATPWRGDFAIDHNGLLAVADVAQADVELELPVDLPLRALLGRDDLLKKVHLRGSAELAEALSFVLPRLRWDAEEDLSRLVGDIAAHRLAQGARDFADWQRQSAQRLAQNFAEYLTQEQPVLVSQVEFSTFRDDLAQLDRSLQALEEKLQRLSAAAPVTA